MRLRNLLPVLVIAAGAYAVAFVAIGSPKEGIGEQRIASLQGCYQVDGQPAFRVSGTTIIAIGESPGFEAQRQKDRDVLLLDRPVQIALQPNPSLVQRGQATLIPIHYGTPLALEISGTDAQPVYATKVPCTA